MKINERFKIRNLVEYAIRENTNTRLLNKQYPLVESLIRATNVFPLANSALMNAVCPIRLIAKLL